MAPRKTAKITAVASPRTTRICAIANNKGGVGKTTTAFNLAGSLVLYGKKVLVLDLDPQCNASIAFNVIVDSGAPGVRHLLTEGKFNFTQCLYPRGPQCDFVPADPDLTKLQSELSLDVKGRFRLRDHLQGIVGNYDFVLLDCPPDLGILTLSALIAATEVIIPVDIGFLGIVGLARMSSFINDVRETYNPALKVVGVLVTKYDTRTTLSENAIAQIRSEKLPLFDTRIRICVDIIRSQIARWPVSLYAENSNGAVDYNSLAEELLAQEASEASSRRVIPLKERRKKVSMLKDETLWQDQTSGD